MKKQKKQRGFDKRIVVVAPTYRQAQDYVNRFITDPLAMVTIVHTTDGLLGYNKDVEFHLIQWRAIDPEKLSVLHDVYGEQRHFVYV